MKFLKKCELCNNRYFKGIHKMDDKAVGLKDSFNLFRCTKCGLIFINPQPSFKELEKHYLKDYYSLKRIYTKNEYIKARLRIFLYNLYFSNNKSNFIQKILFYPILNYIRGTRIFKKGRILDVGSGSGQFLYEMKELGMDVYGIEPGNFDKESVKRHDINIKKTDLISARLKSNFFDVITINQVLEHVPNPSETLRELHRILNDKGVLIIGVPNTNSLAYKLFKENWYQLDVPRHLFDFSDKNLIAKLKKEGFSIKKVRHVSRPTQFTISLKYLLRIKSFGIFEKLLEILFLPLTYLCNLFKKGDSIELWCIKTGAQ